MQRAVISVSLSMCYAVSTPNHGSGVLSVCSAPDLCLCHRPTLQTKRTVGYKSDSVQKCRHFWRDATEHRLFFT